MLTLDELKECGAILGSLQLRAPTGVTSYGELLNLSEDAQAKFDGTVVVDNVAWVATVSGIPVEEAASVYSSDGTIVGRWHKSKRTFYTMQLEGDRLVTKNIIRLKEETKMSDVKSGVDMKDVNNLDLSSLDGMVDGVLGDIGGAVQKMDAFADAKPAATEDALDPKQAAIEGIKRRLDEINVNTIAPDPIVRNNRLHGRLIAFITGTNDAVKLSPARIVAKGADGKPILKPDASAEAKQKWAKGERVPVRECEQKRDLVWKHFKPSAPKAVIISTPIGTDVPLTSMGTTITEQDYDVHALDKKVYIMPIEDAYTYVNWNYGGSIRESDAVLGNKACNLTVNNSFKTTKEGETKAAAKFVQDRAVRKTLLTEGNFFPAKVYETIIPQNLSAADAATLNLNVESIVVKDSAGVPFTEDAKNMFTANDDGSYNSVWFNNGEPISVKRYDDKEAYLPVVQIPVRNKVQKKDGSGYTYQFSYFDMDDMERGPLANPLYAQIANATGIEIEAFKNSVQAVIKRRGSGKKGNKNVLSAAAYLKAVYSNDQSITSGKSLAEIQSELDQFTA